MPVTPDKTPRPMLFSANKFFASWLFESKDWWQHCTGPVLHCEWWPGILVAPTLLKKTPPVKMKNIRAEVNLVICIFDISIAFLVLDAKERRWENDESWILCSWMRGGVITLQMTIEPKELLYLETAKVSLFPHWPWVSKMNLGS